MDTIIPHSDLPFTLDLNHIIYIQLNNFYCMPMINVPTKHNMHNFSFTFISVSNKLRILRINNKKIMVPLLLHKEIINFYYDKLYHSGFTRIHKTVNANF